MSQLDQKKALILGGTGLIGAQITKGLSELGYLVTVVSLGTSADKRVVEKLQITTPELEVLEGDIFLPTQYKDGDFRELLSDEKFRLTYLKLIHQNNNHRAFFLYEVLNQVKPQLVVDAVNSATALSYSDKTKSIGEYLETGKLNLDELLSSLALPRLINFFTNLYHSLEEVGSVEQYVKIGTTGTGGMGFNIPYTHGEIKPSPQLLEKAAISGAFTSLLFLLQQTFENLSVKEIKPAALVGYKEVGFGNIYTSRSKAESFRVYRSSDFKKLKIKEGERPDFSSASTPSKPMKAVFVDTGENGQFSLEEFRTISQSKQMGFVTTEEIAHVVIDEITGQNSGKDIIEALSKSVMGPSNHGQTIREKVLRDMEELVKQHQPSLAFELLGPPRLAKLVFEAYLIGEKTQFKVEKVKDLRFTELSLTEDEVSLIVSVGIPVLLEEGTLIYGRKPKIPSEASNGNIDIWAYEGWVDLRKKNLETWVRRLENYPAKKLEIGDLVAWVFEVEDKGYRKPS